MAPAAFALVDENLRESMSFFGRATGAGSVLAAPDLLLVHSGLRQGVFNMALFAAPAGAADTRRRLERAREYFAARDAAWSAWILEEWLESAARAAAAETLASWGHRVIHEPPGMLAETLHPPRQALPRVEYASVRDQRTRDDFSAVCSVVFDIPLRAAHRLYQREAAWHGSYRGHLGYCGGEPVTAAATVRSPGAIGLYSVGTLPLHRGQGYAESLMREALAREGCDAPVVLQSSPAGLSLYRAMGFRRVSGYRVYLSA
jgi:ribosomal protein S18 acetylase RimI-like enzyme